jgi:hypothetical protein
MLIPLNWLVQKYGVRFTGVLHVGAHECEEIAIMINIWEENL